MIYLILLPMLASFLLVPILGERVVKSYVIAIACALASLFLSVFYLFTNFGSTLVDSYQWFFSGNFSISLTGDNLTLSLAVLVSFISLMVLVFSVFYMRREAQERYYTQMSIFILSMLGLVLSSSLLLFFVFWELVGISSYLLIGFFYKKESAAAAGKKALILTRIGDVSLLAAMVILFTNLNTMSIPAILSSLGSLSQPVILVSGALVLVAALSKSAQFPFYTWLPDAMEGPTPVSALLHSATMVAAGAYLLVLMFPLISAAGLNTSIVIIGLVTAFIAAFLALNHTNIKRIFAYSTIESLSFMFIAIGSVNTGGALFYLFTHAFFKSLLFLISGVIAVLLGTQNIYAMKLKRLSMTWLFIPSVIAFSSLAGLPPFMSFFAHTALASGFNLYENVIFVVLSFMTALFAFRAFFLVFNRKSGIALGRSISSSLPIYILTAAATVGGIALLYFTNVVSSFSYVFDAFTFLDLAVALFGVFLAFELFYVPRYASLTKKASALAGVVSRYAYDSMLSVAGGAVVLAGRAVAAFDDGLSTFYDKLAEGSLYLSSNSRRIQDGDAQTYITAVIIGLIAVLAVASIYV